MGPAYNRGMDTYFHNPRCSKSRGALALLAEHGVEPDVVAYFDTPPSTAEIKALLRKLGLPARDLMRTGEDVYRQLGLADATLSDAALIEAMHRHPILIERPIFVRGDRAVIGRPIENVLQLLQE